jgi:hypothetical protein
MILHAKHVMARCIQRGYEWPEVQPCIVKELGNGYYDFDTDHPAYPKEVRPGYKQAGLLHVELLDRMQRHGIPDEPRQTVGPGAELKKLLARIGITASAGCSCNARAKLMNVNGIQWCEENIETICDWLGEEAEKRGLPFIRSAGKLLIRMAIRNAKKGNSQ